MMREWDVAGRCCAGRGWWCAMACIFWCMVFTHPQPNSANSIRLRKKRYHFMLFGVYAGTILDFSE